MLRTVTLAKVCIAAAILSLVLDACYLVAEFALPMDTTPTLFQAACGRLLRPAEIFAAAVLPTAYGQIICESTPPPHAQLVFVSVVVLLNTVLWTGFAAAAFLARSLRRTRHAPQRI